MIFAVGTVDQLLLYSTQSTTPLGVINNVHYANINDLAWSKDGRLLASSSDGYISIVLCKEI